MGPSAMKISKVSDSRVLGARLLQLFEISYCGCLHFRNEVSQSEETPDLFSCYSQISPLYFPVNSCWLYWGSSILSSAACSVVSICFLSHRCWNHVDFVAVNDLLSFLWILGFLRISSLNLVLYPSLFSFSSSCYVRNLERYQNFSSVFPATIF